MHTLQMALHNIGGSPGCPRAQALFRSVAARGPWCVPSLILIVLCDPPVRVCVWSLARSMDVCVCVYVSVSLCVCRCVCVKICVCVWTR